MRMTRHAHARGRVTRHRRPLALLLLLAAVLFTTAGDWPTYLHDTARTSAADDETILSPSDAGRLVKLWSFRTEGPIAASAAVVDNVVYIGSWDGYEYALDARTGALKWKTFLGVTSVLACNPPQAGVTSSATVRDGVVYVGGGDAYWYALDARTGAVRWRIYTGDNSAAGGHYNWSSPLIYKGYAYIGIASFGDCPLVQGRLLQVSLRTHRIAHTFDVVPRGRVGGGIWSSPTLDAAANTIYVTTSGSNDDKAMPRSARLESLVALDASALTLKGAWRVPPARFVDTTDWGATPVLFSDATGAPMIAATNKNGYAYAFNRTRIGQGPVWRRPIAIGGENPQNGAGSVAPGAFAHNQLYMAGGDTIIADVPYSGSVRALDPATGAYRWQHGAPGTVLGAPVYAHGLIVDSAGRALEVLNAASGVPLYRYKTDAAIYNSPSVSNGRIFVGSVDGHVYAFGLSASPPSPTSAAPGAASPAVVPGAVDLATAYNNVGIADDRSPALASFDGAGYSYSAQALRAAGLAPGQPVTAEGITFRWPDAAPGALDNVVARGQRIALRTPLSGRRLAFLGATSYGPAAKQGVITYADGSTQSFTLGLSDWTLDNESVRPAYHNHIVATLPYRDSGNLGQDTTRTYVLSTVVPLWARKAVVAVTLLTTTGRAKQHIFAMSIS